MRAVKVIAWLNLVGSFLIIATGGAVRLSDSGLGCTTWPFCQDNTGDWHAVVEASNRGVGVVMGILAVLAVLFVWRLGGWHGWRTRRDLWVHVLIILGIVVVEGLLGALVVLLRLAEWTVGVHFLLTMVLVGVATSFVNRSRELPDARQHIVASGVRIVTHLTTLFLVLVEVGGVLVSLNGPHSGDAEIVRTSDLWELFAKTHTWLGYGLGALLLVLLAAALVTREWRYTRAVIWTIAVVAVQIAVGIVQVQLGLPQWLVAIHMMLAGTAVALTVLLVDSLKSPIERASDAELEDQADDGVLNRSAS